MRSQRFVRGNMLFIILLCVVLFAALMFAITQNWRTSSTVSTKEQTRLIAGEIVSYGNGLRPVIETMTRLRGVRDTNIWFAATGANATYGVVGAQATAEVFNVSGGRAAYQTPPSGACLSVCAYEFTGQYNVTGTGSGSKLLTMAVIDVSPVVCQALNDLLGLGWSTIPTGDALTTLARFDGSTYGAPTSITMTGGGNQFVGKQAFCYQESSGAQRYIYLHGLRVR